MIDVKTPLRRAYFQCLNGNISVSGNNVPVYDDVTKLGNTSDPYIILSAQSATDNSSFQTFDSVEDITVEIIQKASGRTNKEVIDFIAGQVMNLVLPTRTTNGLTAQNGLQINCISLYQDRDLSMVLSAATSIGRRILVYRQKVRQTGDGTPGPVNPPITVPTRVTSDEFTTATTYSNPALDGLTYKLFWNDDSIYLERGVDWDYLPGGGFVILISDFNASAANYIFDIILQ